MRLSIPTTAVLVLLATGALAQQQPLVPIGPEFQVNSYATGDQVGPDVEATPEGDFIVVWRSEGSAGSDHDGYSIQARRFERRGKALGDDFQVNTVTQGFQTQPDVAVGSGGEFVVAWSSLNYNRDPKARLFTGEAMPLGDEFVVGEPVLPGRGVAVTKTVGGEFVVAWGEYQNYAGGKITATRFAENGDPIEEPVQVATTDLFGALSTTANASGDFVVSWSDGHYYYQPGLWDVFGRGFAADATPLGSRFHINSYTTGYQFTPRVAATPDGNFIVVWADLERDLLEARRLSVSGQPIGEIFEVTSPALGGHSVGDSGRGQLVVWGDPEIRGREILAGSLEPEFQLNTHTTVRKSTPQLAGDGDGGFLVVWHSRPSPGGDNDGWSLQGRVFRPAVFADDFESGTTANWSSSVGSSHRVVLPGLNGTAAALAVTVGDSVNKSYVVSHEPAGENRFNVSFYIDTDDLVMADGQRLTFLKAFEIGRHHIRLELQWKEAVQQFKVLSRVREASGSYRFVSKMTLLPGVTNHLSVQWHAASGPGEADGGFRLFKDSRLKADVTDLDNDTMVVDFVRLGRPDGGVGIDGSGSFLLDEYVSSN